MVLLMRKKAASLYISAFLLPVVILTVVMIHQGMLPFGDKTFLLWDMDIQYKNIYCWYYDVLHGNASLFYDFSKSLGGNMYSVFACYLASPINLLVYFFPPEKMMYFLAFATVLKIALCGLTCSVYLKKRWKINGFLPIILLSVSYALMEYNVSLCSNLHFLDSIYMLPIVALGVYQLIEQKKGLTLWCSISYSLFCNWYIGYMCCYFSVFYFLFELLSVKRDKLINIRSIRLYVWYMILGVLGGSVTFIPSALASMNGKGQLDFGSLLDGFHNNIYTPLKGFYITSLGNVSYDEPAIYVGGVVCVLVLFYFIDAKVKLREKVATAFILMFLFVSFSMVPLEIMWTMLKRTRSFHFRYAFVFSFLLVMVAAAYWRQLEEGVVTLKKKTLVSVSIGITICGAIGIGALKESYRVINEIYLIFVIVLIGLLYWYTVETRRKRKMVLLIFCSGALLLELTYNTDAAFRRYSCLNTEYEGYVSVMNDVIENVRREDKSFFRMEKTISSLVTKKRPFPPAAAEALMFNYNGITHYSSFYDSNVDEFLAAMGYCKPDAMWSNYCDTNIVADAMLGIKYIITNKVPAYLNPMLTQALPLDGILYKNPYALPFGFKVDADIGNPRYSSNPFDNQKLMLSEMTGTEYEIYQVQDLKEIQSSQWEVEIKDSGATYAYFGSNHGEVPLYVDGEYVQPYYSRAYKNIVYLGMHEAGDTINIAFDENSCHMDHNPIIVVLNRDAFGSAIEDLQESTFEPSVMNDSYVSGIYETEEEGVLLLSVPYDEGWMIKINNKKADYKKVLNGLIAIPVSNGVSEIQLKYIPPYFKLGVSFTIIGILLLLGTELRLKRKGSM